MIDVDQVHQLEARIERLLQILAELREQKAALAGELETAAAGAADTARELKASEQAREAADRKVAELEAQLSQLHTNQAELAEPLNRMLQQLDEFDGGQPDAAPEAAADEAVAADEPDAPAAADEPEEADPPAEPDEPGGEETETAEAAEEAAPAAEAEAAEPEEAEPAAADEAAAADGSAEPAAANADEPAAEADGDEQPPQQRPGPELDIF